MKAIKIIQQIIALFPAGGHGWLIHGGYPAEFEESIEKRINRVNFNHIPFLYNNFAAK
jgi:hypothetical protein